VLPDTTPAGTGQLLLYLMLQIMVRFTTEQLELHDHKTQPHNSFQAEHCPCTLHTSPHTGNGPNSANPSQSAKLHISVSPEKVHKRHSHVNHMKQNLDGLVPKLEEDGVTGDSVAVMIRKLFQPPQNHT